MMNAVEHAAVIAAIIQAFQGALGEHEHGRSQAVSSPSDLIDFAGLPPAGLHPVRSLSQHVANWDAAHDGGIQVQLPTHTAAVDALPFAKLSVELSVHPSIQPAGAPPMDDSPPGGAGTTLEPLSPNMLSGASAVLKAVNSTIETQHQQAVAAHATSEQAELRLPDSPFAAPTAVEGQTGRLASIIPMDGPHSNSSVTSGSSADGSNQVPAAPAVSAVALLNAPETPVSQVNGAVSSPVIPDKTVITPHPQFHSILDIFALKAIAGTARLLGPDGAATQQAPAHDIALSSASNLQPTHASADITEPNAKLISAMFDLSHGGTPTLLGVAVDSSHSAHSLLA